MSFNNKDDFFNNQLKENMHLTPDMLEDVSGGTNTPMSERVFGSLIRSCKKEGKSRESLENYFLTSEFLYSMPGMEGVTTDDAMAFLDANWDKY